MSTETGKKVIPLRTFPTSGFQLIDPTERVEEEKLPTYREGDYYPMRIGDVIRDRYQVVAKLGYGVTSTVWLCRDLTFERKYWALKVYKRSVTKVHELEIFHHLEQAASGPGSEHPGLINIRRLENSFTISSPHGQHVVLVMTPLGMSLRMYQELQKSRVFSPRFVMVALDQALLALNFLHEIANVVHTDIHSDNLLIGIQNDAVLSGIEEDEMKTPSQRKQTDDGGVVHVSKYLLGGLGPLTLCDFGQARIGEPNTGPAMPLPYRAPEVILKLPWGRQVDMWSLGLTLWDLLERKPLFDVYDTDDPARNDAHHLAAMVAVFGRPPPAVWQWNEEAKKYWDSEGNWIGPVPLPDLPHISQQITQFKDGDIEKAKFLSFLGGLLRWTPDTRMRSDEAYGHPPHPIARLAQADVLSTASETMASPSADNDLFDPAAYDGLDLAVASADDDAYSTPPASSSKVPPPPPFFAASRPELFVQPATVAEVERVVRLARHRRRRITTTGCGHSPSDITCTSSWLVNLDRLNRVLAVDPATGLVTAEAGIRLRDLSAALAVAGACATGTHGSSLRHGLLSDAIVALRITLGDGRTVRVAADGGGDEGAPQDTDLFRAALLSLGALGIVVEITFRAVPAFRLRWSQTVDADAVVLAAWRRQALWNQAHFVRVWWFPYTRRAVVWAADDCTETAAAAPDFTPPTSYYDSTLGYLVYHNLLYLARFVPRVLPWVEWFVFGMQYGFRNGTTTRGLQASDAALLMNCLYSQFVNEWALPLARGPEALERLGAWLNRLQPGDPGYVDHRIPFSAEGLYVHAPVEVRVADTSSSSSSSTTSSTAPPRPLLDPTVADGPTLYLNAIMYRPYLRDPPGTARYYEAFEWLMRDLGGKPHWAKCFGADHAQLAAAYGDNLRRFNAVRCRADPDGLFVGPWHRRYLLGDDVPPLPLEEHERGRAVARDHSVVISGEVGPETDAN
ncbi:sugar-lactone oxidase [Niveomyces insectorum RCEF 264]|uniref:D-arabinono-1,4-lactone oxidase n=1 Tax=Niveomyces insectorum RCEF 264 TaxID=1081102 RepID=A0A167UJM9_9HYPO|nr:sugar-lactone oxidase [Niveomyces insectorum RCEF 264]